MKKIIIITSCTLLTIAAIVAIVLLYKKNKAQEEQIQVLTEQIEALSKEDLVDIVIAKTAIKSGTVVDETQLETAKWNKNLMSPNMVTDIKTMKDKIWKIDVSAGGPITADMVAKEKFGATDRLQLVIVDSVSPSLKVGDYIDVRMVTPYGVNYVVMAKKRVTDIYDSGVEVIMSEAELMIYSGLLVDQYMNPGTLVYTSKYLEPTLQKSNYTMYVPPKDILDYMKVNANMIYPYLTADNVQGLRSYIESTQPWTLYGPSTFQTKTQDIIDRQEKITRANNAFASAMKSARSEYMSRQTEVTETQSQSPETPSDTGGSTGQSGAADNSGEYVDSKGVKRDASGNPVIDPSDLSTGVVNPKGDSGSTDGSVTAPQSDLSSVDDSKSKTEDK